MTINVKPVAENRRDFARWAVSHRIRTESQNSFAVPEDLFSEIPQALLDGAYVDGQLYRGSLLGVAGPAASEVNVVQPEPPENEDDEDDTAPPASGTVDEVNAWIGDDAGRASDVLDSGETRKGVLAHIESLGVRTSEDGDPPQTDQGTVVPY